MCAVRTVPSKCQLCSVRTPREMSLQDEAESPMISPPTVPFHLIGNSASDLTHVTFHGASYGHNSRKRSILIRTNRPFSCINGGITGQRFLWSGCGWNGTGPTDSYWSEIIRVRCRVTSEVCTPDRPVLSTLYQAPRAMGAPMPCIRIPGRFLP